MFSSEEIEAIVLGVRLVIERGDPLLAAAALDVLAKVAAVVPSAASEQLWTSPLFVIGRSSETTFPEPHLPLIQAAIRGQQKLRLVYLDEAGQSTVRVIWPLGIAFYSHITLVYTWRELRSGFRSLRVDRIDSCQALETKFNSKSGQLLREFLRAQSQFEATKKRGPTADV